MYCISKAFQHVRLQHGRSLYAVWEENILFSDKSIS